MLYFKNFQFIGPDSITAGIAGECLVRQLNGNLGPYWQWHEAMFEKQDGENSGWGKAADIKNLARGLELDKQGINLIQFNNCLSSRETLAEVESDTLEGKNEGVVGTPSTLINGRLVEGIQSPAIFQKPFNFLPLNEIKMLKSAHMFPFYKCSDLKVNFLTD